MAALAALRAEAAAASAAVRALPALSPSPSRSPAPAPVDDADLAAAFAGGAAACAAGRALECFGLFAWVAAARPALLEVCGACAGEGERGCGYLRRAVCFPWAAARASCLPRSLSHTHARTHTLRAREGGREGWQAVCAREAPGLRQSCPLLTRYWVITLPTGAEQRRRGAGAAWALARRGAGVPPRRRRTPARPTPAPGPRRRAPPPRGRRLRRRRPPRRPRRLPRHCRPRALGGEGGFNLLPGTTTHHFTCSHLLLCLGLPLARLPYPHLAFSP